MGSKEMRNPVPAAHLAFAFQLLLVGFSPVFKPGIVTVAGCPQRHPQLAPVKRRCQCIRPRHDHRDLMAIHCHQVRVLINIDLYRLVRNLLLECLEVGFGLIA